jgi:general secretion pathway protein G
MSTLAEIHPDAADRLNRSRSGSAKRSLGGMAHRGRRGAAGFTLIELLVVLVILGLLAAFAAPQVLKYLGRAKTDAARAQVQNIASILDLYRLEIGIYPDQKDGLDALLEQPGDVPRWNGPYVKRRDALIDPWGQIYVYRFPGEHGDYDLYSLGADQAEGGEGEDADVTSW